MFSITNVKKFGKDHFEDPKVYLEFSIDMPDVYENVNEYNPEKKCINILDDIIADMI